MSTLDTSDSLNLNRFSNLSNIVLMGPPGSGKTTVGRILASQLNMSLIDVDDDVLEPYWGVSVADKLAELGDEKFLEAEGEALQTLNVKNTIISLSGSIPLIPTAIQHVMKDGVVVFLDASKQDIVDRMGQMKVDRIVGCGPDRSLGDVLDMRNERYENSYDLRVMYGKEDSVESIASRVIAEVTKSQAFTSTRGVQRKPSGTKRAGDLVGAGANDKLSGSSSPSEAFSLFDVVQQGLAPDRGLFLPLQCRPLSAHSLRRIADLAYPERALRVMERFPLGDLHPSELRKLLWAGYSSFDTEEVLPTTPLEHGTFLMETFHGPTASFKDLSLQVTPKILGAAASFTHGTEGLNTGLIVATSGDTGCAALDGFGRQGNMPVIVLFPLNGVSRVQQMQMQCAEGDVLVLAVEGDFDDCQRIVKEILNNPGVKKALAEEYNLQLSSGNSINWGRFLPQTTFALSSYLDLVRQNVIELGTPFDLCIPTGNFGNILAAYYAKKLGVPVRQLICASNDNNILSDFINFGTYDLRDRPFHKTISPSIDILISSNVERFVYLLFLEHYVESVGSLDQCGLDQVEYATKHTRELFAKLEVDRWFQLPEPIVENIRSQFTADWCSESDCRATINATYKDTGRIIDPHTAVAKFVADRVVPVSERGFGDEGDDGVPMIISSTAHFAKFPDSILEALGSHTPEELRNTSVADMYDELRSKIKSKYDYIPEGLDKLSRTSLIHDEYCPADTAKITERVLKFLASRYA